MDKLLQIAIGYMSMYYTYLPRHTNGQLTGRLCVIVWEHFNKEFVPHEELEVVEKSKQQNGSYCYVLKLKVE